MPSVIDLKASASCQHPASERGAPRGLLQLSSGAATTNLHDAARINLRAMVEIDCGASHPHLPPRRDVAMLLDESDQRRARRSARAALAAYYARRIAAAFHQVPRGEIEAAVNALRAERRAVLQAFDGVDGPKRRSWRGLRRRQTRRKRGRSA